MKNMINEMKRALAAMLAAAAVAACLCGCAGGYGDAEVRRPWHPPVSTASEDPAPGQTPEKAPSPSVTDTPVPVVPEKPSEAPAVDSADAGPDPAGVQGVARLGGLVGNYAMDLYFSDMGNYVVVDTEDAHNPYDLTWRYGPDTDNFKEAASPEWDDLYESYVDACDWSLVFDEEYYKKAFPMLAKLYHDDGALLLEHFQTQGVHEGRQASARFNVAAYMENCDPALVEAFGEDYECYYFYYMLNQDSQSGVDTKNRGGSYPRWLTVELSLQQSYEYEAVNGYREDAGADPVKLDPETVALANYRAWHDAEHNLYAHDWTTDKTYGKDVDDVLWRLSRDHFAENTVKWYSTKKNVQYKGFAVRYANSESHYAAMVSEKYAYFGCSNPYWSDNPDNPFAKNGKTGFVGQFDMFTEIQPRTPYELD